MSRVKWKRFQEAFIPLLRELGIEAEWEGGSFWRDRVFPLAAVKKIRVSNKPYDKITIHLSLGLEGSLAIDSGVREIPMYAVYVLHVPCRPSIEARAKLKLIKRGVIHREVVDHVWEGGILAQHLNIDSELRRMVVEAGLTHMKVKPVKDGAEVEFKTPVLVDMGGRITAKMELIDYTIPVRELAIAERVAEYLRRLF
jgi:hypothetical protein